jgi:hypothetical protein
MPNACTAVCSARRSAPSRSQVLLQAEGDVQSLALPVFAQIGKALIGSLPRAADTDLAAIKFDALDPSRPQPEQALEEFGSPGADQTGEAEDFAGPYLEAHVGGPARHGQAVHLQSRPVCRRHRIFRRKQVRQFAPDHQIGHLMPRQIGCGVPRNETAIAHHDDFIGVSFNLVEFVRNIDDGHTARFQPGHQPEQRLGLTGRQRRGRLVHDQQPCISGKRLGDFDELLFGDDQLPQGRIRVPVQPHLRQHPPRLGVHRGIVEQPAAFLLVAEKDVLRDGEIFGKVELLVDQDDAVGLGVARVSEMPHFIIHPQFAAGELLVSRENFHQGGLAGAVLADQAVDAARCQIEADAVQHPHGAELLDDTVKTDGDTHRRGPVPAACLLDKKGKHLPVAYVNRLYMIDVLHSLGNTLFERTAHPGRSHERAQERTCNAMTVPRLTEFDLAAVAGKRERRNPQLSTADGTDLDLHAPNHATGLFSSQVSPCRSEAPMCIGRI